MRLSIHAVGRMKSGPARDLLGIYAGRCTKAGRALGIRDFVVREHAESRSASSTARKQDEAEMLLASCADARLVAFDENGEDISSPQFATLIRSALEDGQTELVFAIGGPDGHGDAILQGADRRIRMGRMTWPHQLARVLAAEQIYRAMTILSGHPYHRE
jgi:23S rRNA (pseudouridine1915-N3)-methyltransferase